MRDARPQGGKIRGARRDRVLARRRAREPIDLTLFGDSLARVAGSIVLQVLAFVVWNVGTREPLRVIADLRRAFAAPRTAALAIAAAIVGLIFSVASAILIGHIVPAQPAISAGVHTVLLLVALAIEYLVGNEVRTLAGVRRI